MSDRFAGNIQPSLDLDEHEHLGLPGQDGGGARRVVVYPSIPTSDRNPQIDIAYTDGLMTKVTKTINGQAYERELIYTDGLLTQANPWIAV